METKLKEAIEKAVDETTRNARYTYDELKARLYAEVARLVKK